jgi:hypothetical protein
MCKPEKVLRIRNDRIRETTAILYFAHKVIIKDLFLYQRDDLDIIKVKVQIKWKANKNTSHCRNSSKIH